MNKSEKLSVGQIVFVMGTKGGIVCARVNEEITKKTLTGDSTDYILQIGADNAEDKKLVALSSIETYEVFVSIIDLETSLMDRATKTIQKMLTSAADRANLWYGHEVSATPVTNITQPSKLNTLINDDVVMLSDGTRIKLPARM